MNVAIITKDAADRHIDNFRPVRAMGGTPVLVGEPSTLCGGFFTYWAM
jgi:hypothetical protein